MTASPVLINAAVNTVEIALEVEDIALQRTKMYQSFGDTLVELLATDLEHFPSISPQNIARCLIDVRLCPAPM